ncbi:LysE family translocator [Phyllobacterium myrsinacearum]|uniref:Threonine/homoserine/homoserine lactone efflux protein n=1 Tax=Phyllobacterium myrsinacearum TaxID=28101 RepID=A0A839EST7_9HYPH|nr:LysE family transporter [Phyllobacterium myrsinacearum]MBA8881175.1 threonine/homoserine/homoserine lactone efflux protein [Phyllobacterium myrsinacearum]
MDILNAGLFSLAAIVLLGSPGPGIAALIAVGREKGFTGGLKFYSGLQIGLAFAAGISAAGLFSVIQTLPVAMTIMTILATLYLLYLAYSIVTAPVGIEPGSTSKRFAGTALGGFLLGVTNPKSYIAFVSLMASYPIINTNASADVTVKWLVCVIVMVVVDILWLWLGVIIQKAGMTARSERLLNITMGSIIAATAFIALI